MDTVVKIAVLGYGTIGKGVADLLKENGEIIQKATGQTVEIKRILVLPIEKEAPDKVDNPQFTTSYEEIENDPEISIVVELIGGEQPAMEFMLRAMKAGKNVVTANKLAVAKNFQELTETASEQGVYLLYEASVAGTIPVIRMLNTSLEANKITSIMGIINGTSNYILSKMTSEGMGFDEALSIAQKKGYAEADPTSDIGGYDTLYKLTILSTLAFDTTVDPSAIFREGIEAINDHDIQYIESLGYRVKLLAIAKQENEGLELRVHPTLIPQSHPLAKIDDAYNAVYIDGNMSEDIMLSGKGAGALPTASAVWSDILAIIRGETHFENRGSGKILPIKPIEKSMLRYYIRMNVADKAGVLGEVADVLGIYDVSLRRVSQRSVHPENESVDIVFITHLAKEGSVQGALAQVSELGHVNRIETVLRMEDLPTEG